ncbi:MAG TPA: hypothetical protein VFD01_04915, partial [Candidatus Dormibacteraeota bacterium]|nr:hypothetical protein [Candidatus Dormibacteraeota bacterium]
LTHLGGKPQFFGVARLRSATTSIKGIEKRYAFDHVTLDYSPAGGVRDLERAIERFESQRSPECSFTLHLNLRLLLDWLRDDPGADRWLHG